MFVTHNMYFCENITKTINNNTLCHLELRIWTVVSVKRAECCERTVNGPSLRVISAS